MKAQAKAETEAELAARKADRTPDKRMKTYYAIARAVAPDGRSCLASGVAEPLGLFEASELVDAMVKWALPDYTSLPIKCEKQVRSVRVALSNDGVGRFTWNSGLKNAAWVEVWVHPTRERADDHYADMWASAHKAGMFPPGSLSLRDIVRFIPNKNLE